MYLMELQLELMLSIIDFLPHDDIRQFSLTAKWVRRLIAPKLFKTITFHHPDRELSYWNISTVLFTYLSFEFQQVNPLKIRYHFPFINSFSKGNPWVHQIPVKAHAYHDWVPEADFQVFEEIVSRCRNVCTLRMRIIPPASRPAFGYRIETLGSIRRSLQVRLAGEASGKDCPI
jgi:hypothetical protein